MERKKKTLGRRNVMRLEMPGALLAGAYRGSEAPPHAGQSVGLPVLQRAAPTPAINRNVP